MESTTLKKMTENGSMKISPQRRLSAWLVHLFTASAAILGLLTLYAIYEADYIAAFWFMLAAVFIDSIDGTLARFVKVREAAPEVDGTLLDNIVDYLNYVITPAFFLLVSNLLPGYWKVLAASAVVLGSAYQFTQANAKTPDHFFRGFPSYWNVVVFYLFLAGLHPWANLLIIVTIIVFLFIPIKYLYLSRIDYVFTQQWARALLMLAIVLYGLATLGLLVSYPTVHPLFVYYSWFFGLLYFGLSLYRTFKPLPMAVDS